MGTDVDRLLGSVTEAGALVVGGIALVVLVAGILGEALRAAHRAPRLAGVLLGACPGPARRVAVAVLAVCSLLTTFASPARADDSVRGWLGGGSGATTTTRAGAARTAPRSASPGPMATPDALDARSSAGTSTATPTVSPTGPPQAAPTPVDSGTIAPPAAAIRLPDPVGPTSRAPHREPEPIDATGAAGVTPPPAVTTGDGVAPQTSYTVIPGDCLWTIAARLLGGAPTNARIDAAWRRIYAANRSGVGMNPNLIHPGLVLEIPSLSA